MKKKDNSENSNNFCRNCGSKMIENSQYCSVCGTKTILKKVINDNKYIYYVIASIVCCGLSYIFPFAYFLGLTLIIVARDKYRGKTIVEILFWLEVIIIIFIIIYMILATLMCIGFLDSLGGF